jgi:peptidyl-tRNA hydrolase
LQDALESAHPTQQQLLLKDQRIHELRAQVATLEKRASASPGTAAAAVAAAAASAAAAAVSDCSPFSAAGHAATCPVHPAPSESAAVTQAHHAAQAAHAARLQAIERRADDAEQRARRAEDNAAALKRNVDEQECVV